MSTVYEILQNGRSFTEAELQQSDWELEPRHERKDALRIGADEVMVVNLDTPGRQREMAVCPSTLRQKAVWYIPVDACCNCQDN